MTMLRMPRGKARIVAGVLVGLTALLVGFQGTSTLLTLTQLGASPDKVPAPRTHASLVPQPRLVAAKPSEPVDTPIPVLPASDPAASQPVAEERPSMANAPEAMPVRSVAISEMGLATAARAQALAEMNLQSDQTERVMPARSEPRRRYRAPRPELHKVY